MKSRLRHGAWFLLVEISCRFLMYMVVEHLVHFAFALVVARECRVVPYPSRVYQGKILI